MRQTLCTKRSCPANPEDLDDPPVRFRRKGSGPVRPPHGSFRGYYPDQEVGRRCHRSVPGDPVYTGEVATWRAAQDGTTLLAGGSKLGLSWSVAEAMIDKASALIAKGGLREAACREGLRGREDDELVTNTYLGVQPVKLCEAPAAKPSRKLRAAPGFPGSECPQRPGSAHELVLEGRCSGEGGALRVIG